MSCYPERKNGRHTGVWIAEVRLLGRKVRERFETQKEGDRWAARVKALGEVPEKPEGPQGVLTFREVALQAKEAKDDWRDGRDRSLSQRLAYVVDALGDMPIGKVDVAALEGLKAKLRKLRCRGEPLAPATINRYLMCASGVLRYAWRTLQAIPGAPPIPLMREEPTKFAWLSQEAEDAVCTEMLMRGWHADALVVRVLTATGMRWGELASLTPEQVEQDWIRLWKTKTKRVRSVPITPTLSRPLRALVAAGGMPKYTTISKHLKAALKAAGQPDDISLHTLRHTTATRLVQAGTDIRIVQVFLGHSQIKTTQRYSHINEETLAEAAKKLAQPAGQPLLLTHQKTNENNAA